MNALCKTDLPRKGWHNVDIVDNGDDLQLCPWCERQHYRYGHVMTHPEVVDVIEVGCDCAEKISESYVDAEANQRRFILKKLKEAKAKANREQFERDYANVSWEQITVGKFHGRLFNRSVFITSGKFGGWRGCHFRRNWRKLNPTSVLDGLIQTGVFTDGGAK